MNHRKPTKSKRAPLNPRHHEEAIDLLKEVFVCISIPVVVFAIAYATLDTVVGVFLR